MMGDLILIIVGALIILIPGILTLSQKLSTNKVYDDWDLRNKERRDSILTFLMLFIGCILTCYSGIMALRKNDATTKKNEILNDSLFRTQNRLLALSENQLDTALNILSLTHKLNTSQDNLNHAQEKLISSQNFAFDQLSGGENIPAIRVDGFYKTTLNILDSPIITPQFNLVNGGKTYLKDVQVWASDPYKNLSEILAENDTSFSFAADSNYNKTYEYFVPELDEHGYFKKSLVYSNLNTMPPGDIRPIIRNKLPKNATFLNYRFHVTWSNGTYEAQVVGRYYQGMFYMKFFNYIFRNQLIKNQASFFHGPEIIWSKKYIACGSIKFEGFTYHVYWNRLTHVVYTTQSGTLYWQLYPNHFAASPSEAPRVALEALESIFTK